MLANRDILIFARTAWYANYAKTIVEIAKVLGDRNRVFYLDYQFTFKDLLQQILRRTKEPGWKVLLGFKPRLRRLMGTGERGVWLFTPPPVLPVNFLPPGRIYDFFMRVNARRVQKAARKALRKLNWHFEQSIQINAFNPDYGIYSQGAFAENLHLYYCYDQISAAQWMQKHGPRAEAQFLPMVQASIFTSQGLFEAKGASTPRPWLIRNGVNYSLFKRGFREATTEKRIGYIGALDFRSDYFLLEQVLGDFPDYRFDFVGPLQKEEYRQRLAKFPNFHWHSSRAVEALPDFLATCAAGIIPFARNEFTAGVYPLKVNEYLAAGLPVVCTRFGHMDDFADIIYLAGDAAGFSDALRRALAEDSPAKRKSRTAFAQGNSWQGRVEELSEKIEELERNISSHGS